MNPASPAGPASSASSASAVSRIHAAGPTRHAFGEIACITDIRVSVAGGSVAGKTSLATDLYRPNVQCPRPGVLLRTYLGRARHRDEALGWARAGYVCCVQDVRGRYASDGQWHPYASEQADGEVAVRWLANHPWCDRRVVVAGASYGAFAAWAAAVSGQPYVHAVISSVPSMRPVDMAPTGDGVVPLLGHLAWWMAHGSGRRSELAKLEELLRADATLLEHLPVATLPKRARLIRDGLAREGLMLEELTLDGWLDAADSAFGPDPIPDAVLAGLDVAALHIGGWHDPFVRETLRLHALVGRDYSPRPRRQLILGPWGHDLRCAAPARYGDRDYGPASRLPLGRHQAQWLDTVFDEGPDNRAKLFVTGANRWLDIGWPSRSVAETRLFARSDGGLARAPDAEAGTSRFRYDPVDPFPMRRSPVDERALEARGDVARFTTAPLDEPVLWLGGGMVELFAASDAASTDWVVRLLEVTVDGRVLFLSYGMVDAERHQRLHGADHVPGVVARHTIRLAPMGIRIPAGHRLRLEITSSAFPSHVRNLGGKDRLRDDQPRIAEQVVHWGGPCPTQVRLECVVASDRDVDSEGHADPEGHADSDGAEPLP